MTNFYHPSDTQQYVNPAEIDNFDNFGLQYTHFLTIKSEKDKYKIEHPKTVKMPKAGQDMIEILKCRQDSLLKSLSKLYDFRVIEATADWRLIVGLGSGHVQETGMTLHHIYGIPYIPGSAVKGVLHHWVKDEKIKAKDEDKCNFEDEMPVFGSEDNNEQKIRGNVIFTDAFPAGNIHFAVDIMNPHYSEYYGGETYPADWQNPVPVNFLTVEKTRFRFIFLSKNPDYLKMIADYLMNIFEFKGIGAKTAVGYGYFKDMEDITKKMKEKLQISKEVLTCPNV